MADAHSHFDAAVIGTGQAGIPLAKALTQAGWQVALIEAKHVGGSCVNYGCTPTKTLLASAKVAHYARHASHYGVDTGTVQVRMHDIKKRRDNVVEQFRSGAEEGLEDVKNLQFYRASASFKDTHTLQLQLNDGGQSTLSADKFFINTGASPKIPPIKGLDKVAYHTHISLQELTEVPEHLLILGGGYIGLEFGQMYRRFGSKVTIVQRGPQLLDREDEDVAQCMQQILEAEGIRVLVQADTQEVQHQGQSINMLIKQGTGDTETISGSHLLVATGVQATTQSLHLQNAGVKTNDKGSIRTNEHLQTNVPHIYALGDVKGGPKFTHISYDDYRILRDNLLQSTKRSTASRPVPYCVFTDPQLGRVGMSEQEAQEKKIPYKVAKLPMAKVARGIETGQTQGFYKVLVHAENRLILGAAIIAPEGGEVMTMLEIAMMGKLEYTQLQEGVFAHPTYGESLNNLFQQLED